MISPLRIATFNTLHGIAITGTPNAQSHLAEADSVALAEAAVSLRADVLALQEIDRFQKRSGEADQTALIASRMETDQWRFVPSVEGTPGLPDWVAAEPGALVGPDQNENDERTSPAATPQFGIGLVSRHPVLQWRSTQLGGPRISVPIPMPGGAKPRIQWVPDEPRVALAAVIDTPQGVLTVATAHLSVVPGVNVRQLRTLLRWTSDLPTPLIILGDFNVPAPIVKRATRWPHLVRGATFPSWNPKIQLDHVIARGLDDFQLARAISEIVRLDVSDHCAVVLTLPASVDPSTDSEPTSNRST